MQSAVSSSSRNSQIIGTTIEARRLVTHLMTTPDIPHYHASISSLIQQRNIHRRIQFSYSLGLSSCDYGTYHALERATGEQVHEFIRKS